MSNWPNFFIVGAPKTGTTSLYEYLKNIPDVFLPKNKEPHFFSPKISELINYPNIKTREEYLKLFSNVKNQKAIGEASVHYLQDFEAPYNIQKTIPNAKIIIMLRDPIERSFSHYLMSIRFGETTDSLHKILIEILEDKKIPKSRFYYILIDASQYYSQVKRYYDYFNQKQIKIIIFEEFVKDTTNQVKDVMNFLEIESDILENINKKFNEFAQPRNKFASKILTSKLVRKVGKQVLPRSSWEPIMENLFNKKTEKPKLCIEDKKILNDFFYDDVRMLEEFLGKKMPWKNFIK